MMATVATKEFYIVTIGDRKYTKTNQRELSILLRDELLKTPEITVRIQKVTAQ